jgi:hypothetical protein
MKRDRGLSRAYILKSTPQEDGRREVVLLMLLHRPIT